MTTIHQGRAKGDIKSTLEAARERRRLAVEQRSSKDVEQVRMMMMMILL